MAEIKREELIRKDFVIVKEKKTDLISRVVAPHGIEVGLELDGFRNGLLVRGPINGSGVITTTAGFSGSLTRLTNGRPFINAGTNVQIITGSDGSLTISAGDFSSGVDGSTPFALKASSGISLVDSSGNSARSYDGTGEISIKAKADSSATISVNAEGISVAKLPNSLSFGNGISSDRSFDGSVGTKISLKLAGKSGLSFSTDSLAVDPRELLDARFDIGDTIVIGDESAGYLARKATVSSLIDHIFEQPLEFKSTVKGSITKLVDGSDFIRAGSNIAIVTGSDGSITISSTATGNGNNDLAGQYLNTGISLNESPSGLKNGENRAFELASIPSPASSLMLFYNGQLLTIGQNEDFSLDGKTITLSNEIPSPYPDDVIRALYTFSVSQSRYAFNEKIEFIELSPDIWSGDLKKVPTPVDSLMLFMNGQLLTSGGSDDYTVDGTKIILNSDLVVGNDSRFFATYQY